MIDEKLLTDTDMRGIRKKLDALGRNEELVIGKQTKTKVPKFSMVGEKLSSKEESIDLIQEVMDMTSNEQFCFMAVKKGIYYCPYEEYYIHEINVNTRLMSKTDRNKFSAGFVKLKAKGLMARVATGVYMINPNALIPGRYAKYKKLWDELHG